MFARRLQAARCLRMLQILPEAELILLRSGSLRSRRREKTLRQSVRRITTLTGTAIHWEWIRHRSCMWTWRRQLPPIPPTAGDQVVWRGHSCPRAVSVTENFEHRPPYSSDKSVRATRSLRSAPQTVHNVSSCLDHSRPEKKSDFRLPLSIVLAVEVRSASTSPRTGP